ncbi:NAD(P)-dependent oxidoreductase [Streptomyces mangrovisoli]|uniref:NAD-dependent epimerase n=1 Tax=Streptomyces mangrovisoli TaxID=1428628 RepID=A0A1J4P1X7_9ACTN|nr:NAD(P)H-binding protein [Streptomyces mangrovisoli]OIJ68576.1 NAD-dependent epimerase [Streptomyces mangrovisoli]
MRIALFGAAGPTGRELTSQALAAGHEVTAVTRRPDAVPPRPGLAVAAADALDPDAVERVVAGHDAVLSALGAPPGRTPTTLYSAGAAHLIAAMERHGVRRLLVVSSSVLDPAWRPSGAFFFNNVLDPYVNRIVARTAHDDMRRMEAGVRASGLDWTIVRPSGLFDHPAPTRRLVTEDSADGVFTARADLAASMLDELREERFTRRVMGVATTEVRPNVPRMIWREIRKNARGGVRNPAGDSSLRTPSVRREPSV